MDFTIIFFLLTVAWMIFSIALCYIDLKSDRSIKLEKFLWNARIDEFNKKPFTYIMKAYEEKSYFKTFLWVIALNLMMNIAMFAMGLLLIGVLIAGVQAFMMGAIIAQGDGKTKMFGVLTAIFELSAFTISSGMGFLVTRNWLLAGMNFTAAFQDVSRYWWIPALLLLSNGLVEASGVLIGAKGVPGVEAVKNKAYK